MPRRPYKKIEFRADPVYGSLEVAKLITFVMRDGKKEVARNLIYKALERIKGEGQDPLNVLLQAIQNVAPQHEVRPRRLGGASYLVPIEVRRERKLFLALNWIIDAANSRSNKEFRSFENKLYTELIEASKNQGNAVAKKTQVEKLAESNKAFAHLKW